MEFNWWTFGLQTINFIILVWLLKLFLYRPVMAAIARRQAVNKCAIEDAQEAEKRAQSEIEKFEKKYEEIEAARKQIIADAHIAQSRAYDKLMREGKEEIVRLRDLSRKDIERESHKARIELRQASADLAVTLARHILQESRTVGLDDIFLEKIIAHLKSLPPVEFKNFQDQLDGTTLGIISAEPLDEVAKKKWRSAIRALFGKGVRLSFSVDSELIAGINFKFPGGLVSFNWRDSLSQSKAALYERADSP